jgi:hypothetical protein
LFLLLFLFASYPATRIAQPAQLFVQSAFIGREPLRYLDFNAQVESPGGRRARYDYRQWRGIAKSNPGDIVIICPYAEPHYCAQLHPGSEPEQPLSIGPLAIPFLPISKQGAEIDFAQ